jgi:hypothetical protein
MLATLKILKKEYRSMSRDEYHPQNTVDHLNFFTMNFILIKLMPKPEKYFLKVVLEESN